ncbi:MAG: PorT family protein [Brumimicrobium sp.]|nr:PorT family protein [Brumimicrobium sp.]
MNKYWVIILLFGIGIHSVSFAQKKQKKNANTPKLTENFFGFQFKPIIPFRYVGDQTLQLNKDQFESTIKPTFGYYYGGVVRVGLTKLLALETGISYVRRNYNVEYRVPDSSLVAKEKIGFVSFEVPLDLLVYIRLGQQFYMNVSGGMSGNFNPSNIRSPKPINPSDKHLFIFEGRRLHFFDFNVNANIGFEYRTEKAGIFYLGISTRIPLSYKLYVATEYRYDTQKVVAFNRIRGSVFGFDVKYFFPNLRKKESPFMRGPIEN